MADFGPFDIAASWAWEKEGARGQVLQVEGSDDTLDWDHAGKADSAKREDQSAVGPHHRDGSDGGQE